MLFNCYMLLLSTPLLLFGELSFLEPRVTKNSVNVENFDSKRFIHGTVTKEECKDSFETIKSFSRLKNVFEINSSELEAFLNGLSSSQHVEFHLIDTVNELHYKIVGSVTVGLDYFRNSVKLQVKSLEIRDLKDLVLVLTSTDPEVPSQWSSYSSFTLVLLGKSGRSRETLRYSNVLTQHLSKFMKYCQDHEYSFSVIIPGLKSSGFFTRGDTFLKALFLLRGSKSVNYHHTLLLLLRMVREPGLLTEEEKNFICAFISVEMIHDNKSFLLSNNKLLLNEEALVELESFYNEILSNHTWKLDSELEITLSPTSIFRKLISKSRSTSKKSTSSLVSSRFNPLFGSVSNKGFSSISSPGFRSQGNHRSFGTLKKIIDLDSITNLAPTSLDNKVQDNNCSWNSLIVYDLYKAFLTAFRNLFSQKLIFQKINELNNANKRLSRKVVGAVFVSNVSKINEVAQQIHGLFMNLTKRNLFSSYRFFVLLKASLNFFSIQMSRNRMNPLTQNSSRLRAGFKLMDSCSNVFGEFVDFFSAVSKLFSVFPNTINEEVIKGMTYSKELINFLEELFSLIPQSSKKMLNFNHHLDFDFILALLLFFRKLESTNILLKSFLGIIIIQTSKSNNEKFDYDYIENSRGLDFWFFLLSLDYILAMLINVLEGINFESFCKEVGSNSSVLETLNIENFGILFARLNEKEVADGDNNDPDQQGLISPTYSLEELEGSFTLPENSLELCSQNLNSSFLLFRIINSVKFISTSKSGKKFKKSSFQLSPVDFNKKFTEKIINLIKSTNRPSGSNN